MSNASLIGVAACMCLAIMIGKKYPVIGGALFCVALLIIFWAPGGVFV